MNRPERSNNSCNSIWNLKSNYGSMSCLSRMSPPATWPPHSSEQIFEAGIRTCCHAYLNKGALSSHQNSQPGLEEGPGVHARGRACWEVGVRIEPTYTFMAENTGWKQIRAEKPVMSSLYSYTLSSSNSTPNTQPLNKQGDSISEVELNSLKQFLKKKKKKTANWSLLGITQRSLFTVSFP